MTRAESAQVIYKLLGNKHFFNVRVRKIANHYV